MNQEQRPARTCALCQPVDHLDNRNFYGYICPNCKEKGWKLASAVREDGIVYLIYLQGRKMVVVATDFRERFERYETSFADTQHAVA